MAEHRRHQLAVDWLIAIHQPCFPRPGSQPLFLIELDWQFWHGFGSLGLPALAGFIAEVTVFLGAFDRFEWAVLMSIFGVVLSAGYVLWMLQRVVFGPVKHEWDGVTDQHHWWEHAVVADAVTDMGRRKAMWSRADLTTAIAAAW